MTSSPDRGVGRPAGVEGRPSRAGEGDAIGKRLGERTAAAVDDSEAEISAAREGKQIEAKRALMGEG